MESDKNSDTTKRGAATQKTVFRTGTTGRIPALPPATGRSKDIKSETLRNPGKCPEQDSILPLVHDLPGEAVGVSPRSKYLRHPELQQYPGPFGRLRSSGEALKRVMRSSIRAEICHARSSFSMLR